MELLICIDDTDNLEAPGTGKLAHRLGELLEEQKLGAPGRITRHQLFVHPDVPYTSHNSSMCMDFYGRAGCLNDIIAYASEYLVKEGAEGSDPGLAVAVPGLLGDNIKEFIDYGKRAKISVLFKKDAWAMAGKMGIHLSEHGGTGDGIIGALAGISLRLGGNDGRFRGKFRFDSPCVSMKAEELIAHPMVDRVVDMDSGNEVTEGVIEISDREYIKTIHKNCESVLCVRPSAGSEFNYVTLTKTELKIF